MGEGFFGPISKSARVLVQLIHGLLHLRRAGTAAQGAYSHQSLARRAQKLHRLCVSLLDHLEVECKFSGPLPDRGLLVTNHVSFLDIMFLGALKPMVFVSKSEVAQWPLVGNIATSAGTIYVERSRRSDVSRVNIHLKRALEAGLLVTLFPEGTSSDGTQVLPFQASLLQPAIDLQVPVTPGHLSYSGHDRSRADDIAYFGDRDLAPCLLALLNRSKTVATLKCAKAVEASDRKKLTAALHTEVVRLSSEAVS
jgi:1-acyl-sn-glycerol-3-phosphate acyltransferase